MMIRSLLTATILVFGGCAAVGLSSDSIGVVTEEYGQCIVNMQDAPSFNKKKVTFRCENDRVLLGDTYEKEGVEYIDSAILFQKEGQYAIKDRRPVRFVRGLHTLCEIEPVAGDGDQKIRRFYFDMKLKECRPFDWSGKGGLVPFKNRDECEQYCYYRYQG